MAKVLSGAGLRGQVAGKTALSTVGVSGSGLTYRGYDVKDLANNCQFEEVAYLILKGKLPNQTELDEYKAKLKGMRSLPQALLEVLERIPADAHPIVKTESKITLPKSGGAGFVRFFVEELIGLNKNMDLIDELCI